MEHELQAAVMHRSEQRIKVLEAAEARTDVRVVVAARGTELAAPLSPDQFFGT